MSSEDEPNSSTQILASIQKEFTCMGDGSIRDSFGHSFSVWRVTDFHRWWLAFESHAGVPLGRKLMNAATDQEEYFLNESSLFDIGWLMKKKRIKSILNQRWKQMGWGQFSVSNQTAFSHVVAPLCSGFALATLEAVKSHRLKVQWRQISNVQIQLDTDADLRSISPAPQPPIFDWDSNSRVVSSQQQHPISLDFQANEHGWSHAGEQCFFLPIGVLSRLFESVNMQGLQLSPELLEHWEFPEQFNPAHVASLILTSLAMNDVVSQSERPIYIQDLNSWNQLVEAYLKPLGFGSFASVHALDDQGGVEFELLPSPLLPITTGFLVAFWQRGIGRKAKVKMVMKNGNWSVQITSFLAYTG
ncbi:MAG: hypothetical protein CL926_00565 [Deltaproteobacteria bacterium]|nr:hypothetical protein [Deltaproteobacteria bacterium]|tara:strand:+ start:1309 stop:2385 length:1077 start_codon:yes stop_codon:yes gene_type:complete